MILPCSILAFTISWSLVLGSLFLSAANISSLKGVIKVKAENATAEVYNISGILVNKMLVAGEASIPVTPGVYIVIVASSTNKSTSKVIVN